MIVTTHASRLFLVCIVLASAGVMLPAQTIDPAKPVQDDPLTRPRKDQKPAKLEKAYQKWL